MFELKSNKLILTLHMALLLSSSIVLAEEEGPFAPENFSANITLTSDYIFRGETQSANQPAVQGGFDWAYNNFNLGIWVSNVDFTSAIPDTLLEVDYYAGYSKTIGSFDYSLNLFYYTYPGANDGTAELDYFELLPSLSYTFSDVTFEPSVYVQYGFSPDYFGEEGTGHNFEGGIGFSLPIGFGLDGWVGYQEIDGDALGTDIEWTYWSVGLTKSVLGFDLDLRYHGEDEDTSQAFGPWLANDGFSDDLISFSISRSF